MARFSERYEYSNVRDSIQLDYIDEQLQVGLWNVLDVSYWSSAEYIRRDLAPPMKLVSDQHNRDLYVLVRALWADFFKAPLEEITKRFGSDWDRILGHIRDFFFGNTAWWALYDFIEFVAENHPDMERNARFRESANVMLEREMSAWRFVGPTIAQITSEEEIASIDAAMGNSAAPNAAKHIESALALLSDREDPDYRNSVKESISAIEAAVRLATDDEDATLSDGVKLLSRHHDLHPAMRAALLKLYGYASDEGRHSACTQRRARSDHCRSSVRVGRVLGIRELPR